MVTNIIEIDDISKMRRIGHEFWDKRFLFLRDKQFISVLDLNSLLVTKIIEVLSENFTIGVDMVQKKVMVFTSQIVDGEFKIMRVEVR